MNASFLSDGLPPSRHPGEELLQYVRALNEGSTRNTRGTPKPNETGEAFHSQLQNLDRDLPEPTATPRSWSVHQTAPEHNLGDGSQGFDAPRGSLLYRVKTNKVHSGLTGDPYESGLFTTDRLDPRPPESLAWLGNHRRPGWDPAGKALIHKEFNDMDQMASGPYVLEGSPSEPREKTSMSLGRYAAFREFGLWR